ncbi:MAG: type III glutamate--ammonia ligase, partial [Acidobacteria bacterium]|nr:type III glutamate--ammonia ligase [Acidobacteriota bacterium]
YQIDHEDGNGQFEINFTYADAVTTADRYILFKMASQSIARKHGLICSFMPKPMSDRTGSGMHMHLSLGKNGGNDLADENDPRGLGLAKLGYQFLGGLFEHAAAMTAISCPTVNSYKRMVVGGVASGATWAPTFVCYGDNNRTAFVRVAGNHIEIRSGDSSANPYLFTAAAIAAGLDGIQNDLDPGEPRNINLYKVTAEERKKLGIGNLPQSLDEALDALEADPVVRAGIGENLAAEFIRLKRAESEEYRRAVTDWEVDRYLRFF